METFWQGLCYGIRRMAKNSGFTLPGVTLGLVGA